MNYNDASDYIHSPFVALRDTIDNGFSGGWGLHFQPSEEYWLDCHNHLESGKSYEEISEMLSKWFSELDAYRLERVLVISKDVNSFSVLKDLSQMNERFEWLYYHEVDKGPPDPDLFRSALNHGAVGFKLHNAPIMKGLAEPEIWLNEAWSQIFELASERNIPLLWHVTQRVSASPYHGGGENSYWQEGWQRGIKFNNQDLLDIFLKVLRNYPDLKVVGAHQLHVGLDKLRQLLKDYSNLYIDTSCGFFLRWADILYEPDRKILRDFCIEFQDRILFGSDCALVPGGIDRYLIESFLGHARFINQLRLPYDVLNKIAHKNSEKVFNLQPLNLKIRRGNIRP